MTAIAIYSPNPNQASWGATCCATNLTTLASYSDANATDSTVLAGLQLCFDNGVIADENLNARLSNPRCITAWATLCARDEVLGEWMQEKVRSEPDYPDSNPPATLIHPHPRPNPKPAHPQLSSYL